ncbi:MFS transporter [Phenylobacterium zucineum]|uniref:MFS transporter n=1 Tax=Phenylobacterium zucineum TaxID=284016 RepID=UPI00059BB31B|nr:MFS transporter [Phenylobacterium zucineum]
MTKLPTWKHRYTILAVLFVTWAVAFLDRMAMPVALPYIAKEFGLQPFQTSFILSAFFVGYALAQMPGGILADRIGARKVATIAMLWWSCVDGSRVARLDLMFWRLGRVQSCVRPVDAVVSRTAGPDGVRKLGPTLLCRLRRLGHYAGCPSSRSDRFAITSHRARNLRKLVVDDQLICQAVTP